MNTASILGLLKTRIEALTPSTQAGPDDVFNVHIATTTHAARRQVLLEATAGRRILRGGQTCNDWETAVEMTVSYPETRTETGADTILQTALGDAEDLLADLYTWATTTSGIIRMDPELGVASDEGDGTLTVARALNIIFERS